MRPAHRAMKRFRVTFRLDDEGRDQMYVYLMRHNKRRYDSRNIPGVFTQGPTVQEYIGTTLSKLILLYFETFTKQPWERA